MKDTNIPADVNTFYIGRFDLVDIFGNGHSKKADSNWTDRQLDFLLFECLRYISQIPVRKVDLNLFSYTVFLFRL